MEGWRISHLNERKKERTIYVDADACPVKDEILSVASQFQVPVTFIASYEHFQTKRSPLEDWRFVDTHKEAADLVIANLAVKHDMLSPRILVWPPYCFQDKSLFCLKEDECTQTKQLILIWNAGMFPVNSEEKVYTEKVPKSF